MKNAKTLIKSQCRNTHQALMCFLCFFFFFAGMHQVVHAVPDVAMKIDQDVHITGIVQDTNKEPMIGVSVMVKGTTNGTVTDIDGNYSLSVQGSKSVLVFSFVGYVTKEVTVGSQKTINVTLAEDSKMIDEVVVIGFQSQKKGNSDAEYGAGRRRCYVCGHLHGCRENRRSDRTDRRCISCKL